MVSYIGMFVNRFFLNISPKGYHLVNILILIIVSGVVYCPVLFNEFQVAWDDQWVVMNIYTESGFEKENLINILFSFYNGQYAPINQLYYTLLYAFFGYNSFWFHLFSLVFHLINIVLVYFLVLRVLSFSERRSFKSVFRMAFFTSILLAIHPFLSEAVAWVSASKVLIYSLFYLIAVHLYISYFMNKSIIGYLGVLMFFVLSFGAKEQAITLPFCLILIDIVYYSEFTGRETLIKWRIWRDKIPLILLSIFFGAITMFSQSASGFGPLSRQEGYPFYQRIVFGCYAFMEYVTKCIIPVNISYLYPFPIQVGETLPGYIWIYPVSIIFLIVLFFQIRINHLLLFGFLFFIVHIILVLHLIPISRFAIVADRYVYIASVGVFFSMAYLADWIIRSRYFSPKIFIFGSLFYVVFLGFYSHERSKSWHNSDTLKQDIKKNFDSNDF